MRALFNMGTPKGLQTEGGFFLRRVRTPGRVWSVLAPRWPSLG